MPVLAKHSKSVSLVDAIAIGVDRMQRTFEPRPKETGGLARSELAALTDVTAKINIYQVFIEGESDVSKHLARRMNDSYFEPRLQEFKPRTVRSLSNAFTSATMVAARAESGVATAPVRCRGLFCDGW